jgi:hypothetical protein
VFLSSVDMQSITEDDYMYQPVILKLGDLYAVSIFLDLRLDLIVRLKCPLL